MHTFTFKLSIYKLAFVAVFGSLVITGCASNTPHIDEHFGEAVNAAKAQQTINPDASKITAPVSVLDGQAADAAIDRYHKSFVQPPVTTNIFNIGVGTGTGAGSTGSTSGGTR